MQTAISIYEKWLRENEPDEHEGHPLFHFWAALEEATPGTFDVQLTPDWRWVLHGVTRGHTLEVEVRGGRVMVVGDWPRAVAIIEAVAEELGLEVVSR